jgi:hypothetical protein
LPSIDACAVSTDVRSVPALISEQTFRTSTPPGRSRGTGNSSTRSSPVFWYWVTCNIERPPGS